MEQKTKAKNLTKDKIGNTLSQKTMLYAIIVAILAAFTGLITYVTARPTNSIGSYDECVSAGNPIQESYPEQCVTKDGRRFVNPRQILNN